MCQIIVKPEGKKFNMSKLDKAQGWNEDGYGVTWWEDEELHTFKTMNYNRFKAILSTLKKHKAVAHLRNTTRGDTCNNNNHPFDIPSGVMFHNGTISGLSCSTVGGSDTMELASLINDCSYAFIQDLEPLLQHIIGDTINRLVFFEDNGEITFINKDLGQEEDGIWYSNDYHTRDTTRDESYNVAQMSEYRWCPVDKKYVPKGKEKTLNKANNKNTKQPKKTKVFVYGTLKEGFGNHNYFLADALKLGKATSVTKWDMVGEGKPYPYLLGRNKEGGMNIKGEVYEVTPDELQALDDLEGVPYHYTKSYMYVKYENSDRPCENVLVYVKANPTKFDYSSKLIDEFKADNVSVPY